MPRYLIQVPHDPLLLGCLRAFEALAAQGSHFVVHADWGCEVGEHKDGSSLRPRTMPAPSEWCPSVIRKTAPLFG